MQVFRVNHLTRYRYARPVQFGEHRMMLRPLDHPDQIVIHERLVITPEPRELSFVRDALGNWVGVAQFDGAASELCFQSEVHVERRRLDQPQAMRPARSASVPRAAEPTTEDQVVAAWARRFAPPRDGRPGLAALTAMTHAVHADFRYRHRLEHGVQSPRTTLELRSGACRDFAMLLVAAGRALGLRARFVSGYVHCGFGAPDERHPGTGHTHAWASIHTPERGWMDFDPTSGAVGADGMIRVAVADEPGQAIPIQGVYFGGRDDFLGMDVEVHVDADHKFESGGGAREPGPILRVADSTA